MRPSIKQRKGKGLVVKTAMQEMWKQVLVGEGISERPAREIFLPLMEQLRDGKAEGDDLHPTLRECVRAAETLRKFHFGHRASLCAILNAKSGNCGENCTFCAQSVRSRSPVPAHPLVNSKEILQARRSLQSYPVQFFSIVSSGKKLERSEIESVAGAMHQASGESPRWCASLGCLEEADLRRLQQAGMVRYHHNLEVAESYFPEVCTTHTYRERLDTVRRAKQLGLQICCGGIFGVGESPEQRLELATALVREEVDSIPLNFLIPLPGTPMENRLPLSPQEALAILTMFRLIHPKAEIRVAGGRELLGPWQSYLFQAGANGMMVGDLLTVEGKQIEEDLRMLREAEMQADRSRDGTSHPS